MRGNEERKDISNFLVEGRAERGGEVEEREGERSDIKKKHFPTFLYLYGMTK
jgi:hypothetical protein